MSFLVPFTDADSRTTPWDVVSVADPAIDFDATPQADLDGYQADPTTWRKLRPKPGMRLTRYEVHPLSQQTCDELEGRALAISGGVPAALTFMQGILYYMAAVRAVHDIQIEEQDGTFSWASIDGMRVKTAVPRFIRQEIGGYARRLSSEAHPDFFGRSASLPSDTGDDSDRCPTANEEPCADAPSNP